MTNTITTELTSTPVIMGAVFQHAAQMEIDRTVEMYTRTVKMFGFASVTLDPRGDEYREYRKLNPNKVVSRGDSNGTFTAEAGAPVLNDKDLEILVRDEYPVLRSGVRHRHWPHHP